MRSSSGLDRCRFATCVVLSCSCLWILFLNTVTCQNTTNSFTTPLPRPYCRTVFNHCSYCRTVFNHCPYCCPLENYADFTCMVCYSLLPPAVVLPGMYNKLFFLQADPQCRYVMTNKSGAWYPASDFDFKNESSAIYQIITAKGKRLWHECCEAAKKCCDHMNSTPTKAKPGGPKYCPKTFDGWQCFDETEAGKIHESVCEDHIRFVGDPLPCPGTVFRKCNDDGTWPGVRNVPNTEWTNYTSCSDMSRNKRKQYVHVAALLVTICSLIPAITIFFSYKELRIPRITMHKNLFLSLLLNGILLVIYKFIIVLNDMDRDSAPGTSVERVENSAGCRFLFAITRYTRATNYMWTFGEGFYLHKLIVAAFAEQKRLLLYYILGWGLPVVPVVIYSALRLTDSVADERCWAHNKAEMYEWVLTGPNLLSLILNLLFLANIIRVLVTKLRNTHTNDPHKQYRKAVRATLVLIPLFGLHLFVTVYVPSSASCFWNEFFYYFHYLTDGLQGFLIALIFCYLNGEVIFLLRRSFRRWRLRRRPEDGKAHHFNDTRASTVMSTSEHNPTSGRPSQTLDFKTKKPTENGK